MIGKSCPAYYLAQIFTTHSRGRGHLRSEMIPIKALRADILSKLKSLWQIGSVDTAISDCVFHVAKKFERYNSVER
jgi:hypothetical protein